MPDPMYGDSGPLYTSANRPAFNCVDSGGDECPQWVQFYSCETDEPTNFWGRGFDCLSFQPTNDCLPADPVSAQQCIDAQRYWIEGQVGCFYLMDIVGQWEPPEGAIRCGTEIGHPEYLAINQNLLLLGELGCDNSLCHQETPWDPDDPDPDPGNCACGSTFTDTAECYCEADTVRVTIDGTLNCLCIECGTFGEVSVKLTSGQTADGTYDMPRIGPGEWLLTGGWNTDYSLPPDAGQPPNPSCGESFLTDPYVIWLKKIDATHWQFAIIGGPSPAPGPNPHDLYTSGAQNFLLFKGSATGDNRGCLSIPDMENELVCGFDSNPAELEDFTICNFFITEEGVASFDACVA